MQNGYFLQLFNRPFPSLFYHLSHTCIQHGLHLQITLFFLIPKWKQVDTALSQKEFIFLDIRLPLFCTPLFLTDLFLLSTFPYYFLTLKIIV